MSVLLSVAESTVHVLEEDDGSGWVKVADDSGGKGLVPASYIEFRELGGAQAQARSATPSLGRPQATANVDYGTYNGSVLYRPAPFSCFAPFGREADGRWGRAVRGIYAYKAQGPDEIDVDDGGLIQLTEGPNGGRRYGEGWWEGAYLGSGAEAPCNCCCPSRCPGLMGLLIAISGIDASGKQGIFPSNYVSARSDKSREAPWTDSAPSNPIAGGGCAVTWSASIGSRAVCRRTRVRENSTPLCNALRGGGQHRRTERKRGPYGRPANMQRVHMQLFLFFGDAQARVT